MFELPRYVIKSGQVIVEHGEIREPLTARRCTSRPSTTATSRADIADWFEKYYSIRFRNYPVGDEYLPDSEAVPCR